MRNPGATPGYRNLPALTRFRLERGPASARPRRVAVVDALPETGAGKVDRAAVEAAFAARGRLRAGPWPMGRLYKAARRRLASASPMTSPQKPPKPVRPVDAASVVLHRLRGGRTEILMGRRHAGHSFMPKRWVFPGGRVDPEDSRVRPATPLRPEVEARMALGMRSPARARALGVAAVRETFEEAGLLIAAPAPARATAGETPPAWRAFFELGLAPALDRLDLFMRAITPTYSPKRFHARFFLADAAAAEGEVRGSGELEGLVWLSFEEALALPLADVTEAVVREAERVLGAPDRLAGPEAVPLYSYRGRTRNVRNPTGIERCIVST